MIIKICGMREPDNIRAVATLVRPDWMGFICWPGSKRFVAQVPAYLPQPPVQRVGVFVDAPVQYVRQQAEALGLHLIQLHGHEDEQYSHAIKEILHLPIIKAFGISDLSDIVKVNAYASRSSADYLLFDTSTPLVGGSGRQFDWSLLRPPPLPAQRWHRTSRCDTDPGIQPPPLHRHRPELALRSVGRPEGCACPAGFCRGTQTITHQPHTHTASI